MASKRVLVTGGRDFSLPDIVHHVLYPVHRRFGIEELAHGGATGFDELSKLWALSNGIPTAEYECSKAEWDVWGNRAGNMRNSRMLRLFKPSFGVAGPGGTGTADMTRKLIEAGVPTLVGTWVDVDHTTVRWKLKNG